jgi:site-specific DNA-methyltransferase (adenine-specific)
VTVRTYLNGRVTLLTGDCREQIKTLADASIDSCVCDPPYALVSIAKRFGAAGAVDGKSAAPYRRTGAGFMGKQWDNGEAAFAAEFWAEVMRVLKPGGYVLAFGGTRTYHRLACAIEDAGFEIRDQIGWTFGAGFPKSHNVSKAIDRSLGASGSSGEFKSARAAHSAKLGRRINGVAVGDRPWMDDPAALDRMAREYLSGSPEARQWDGWGTALKPAWEPICMARKALVGTVAANVLEHGTGALNIDGCRVGTETRINASAPRAERNGFVKGFVGGTETEVKDFGRWPANLIHDGSDEVVAAFPEAPGQGGSVSMGSPSSLIDNVYGARARVPSENPRTDEGSAARFFYTAKADADDRLGSKHPTVKPLDLMQYLVRLVTPPGGLVLDCFAGTGVTGEAAWREGMRAVLIEREPEYQADIVRRMELAENPTKRSAVAASKNNLQGAEGTPLFSEDAA